MIFKPVLLCCLCVQICSVSDTLHALQPPAPPRSTRRGLSGIGCRPAQRPGVCAGARPVVGGPPCIWYGLCCCLCCAVVPGALWLGSPPEGYTGSAGGGAGDARDKIFQRKRRFSAFPLPTPTPSSQNETSIIVQYSKFSEKYKKAPLPV